MGIYAHTGLPIRPCVAAAGIPDLARAPDVDGVVDAGEAGIAVADAIGRELRGAGHGRDLPVPMAHGARLLVFEDRAFAVAREQQPHHARRPRRAGRPAHAVGRCSSTRRPGATVNVDFLTAGQDWALPVCLDARLIAVARRADVRGRDARAAGALHPQRGLPLGGCRRSARRRRGPAG